MGMLTKQGLASVRSFQDLETMINIRDLARIVWVDFVAAVPDGLPGKWTLHIYERGCGDEGKYCNELTQFPLSTETVNQMVSGHQIQDWEIQGYTVTSFGHNDLRTTLVTGPLVVSVREMYDGYGQPIVGLLLAQHDQLLSGSLLAHGPVWSNYIRNMAPVWVTRRQTPRGNMPHVLVRDLHHVILQLERTSVADDNPDKFQEILIFGNSFGVMQWAFHSPASIGVATGNPVNSDWFMRNPGWFFR